VKTKLRRYGIYERVRNDILVGRLAPGQALQETELARRLSGSRTPIREALRMLQNDGLVSIAPNRGAVVTEMSVKAVLEAYEVREVLEPYSAVAGMVRFDQREIRRLISLHEGLRTPPATFEDALSFDRADEELHGFVARGSGNELIQQTIRKARTITRRVFLVVAPERYEQSMREHLGILRAFLRRDEGDVKRLLSEHLRRARERLLSQNSPPLAIGAAKDVLSHGARLPRGSRASHVTR
jgi:DNA-binding GntR family transcriptional regulator